MNKIVVYRTHIEINDYTLGDCPSIERTFSIYNMTYHKVFPKGMIYDEKRRVLMLPRGMNIGRLENLFHSQPVVDMSVDPMASIAPVKLKYKPRDTVQQEAIKFMLSTDKYHHNETNTMLSVNLNTGKGKTYCAIAVAAYMGYRPIVIANNVDWLRQWNNFFLEYTDITQDEIYMVSGAPAMMKLYNRDISKYKVILATHNTLKSVGDGQGWDKISDFFKYMQIGIKFYDEAHLNFDNMFRIDCHTNTFITYYLTATPARSNFQEDAIFSIYFKNVPSIDLFNRDEDPHTKYAGIRFNSKPTPIEAARCKNQYGLDRMAYANYIVHNDRFRQLLVILVDMAIRKPGKHLFYIGTNDAILHVRDIIYEEFPCLIGQVGIYTSIVPPEIKAGELEKKIILTTTKSAGASLDIKGLVETVNLAEPFKSRVLAQQTFGRTRDYNTMYKDVVDTGFLYTNKFYNYKKPVFKKYATECVEVNLTQDELNRKEQAVREANAKLIDPLEFFDPNDQNRN